MSHVCYPTLDNPSLLEIFNLLEISSHFLLSEMKAFITSLEFPASWSAVVGWNSPSRVTSRSLWCAADSLISRPATDLPCWGSPPPVFKKQFIFYYFTKLCVSIRECAWVWCLQGLKQGMKLGYEQRCRLMWVWESHSGPPGHQQSLLTKDHLSSSLPTFYS